MRRTLANCTLTVLRKGGKVVTVPLAPRTARAIDLAIGERCEGPIFLGPDGNRLDRYGAGRNVRRVAPRAGITKRVGPHTLRHAFITAALAAGVPLRTYRKPLRRLILGPRCATTGRECPLTGTPATSSRRPSPAPPDRAKSGQRSADIRLGDMCRIHSR